MILAAIDPHRDDAGSAALGLVLAEVTGVAVATAGFSADQASTGLETIGVGFLERPDGRAALAYAGELARAAGRRPLTR